MRYAFYVFYRFINESKSPADALLSSKMVLSMLLCFNAITFLMIILPDWILDTYIGYMFLSLPIIMVVSLLINDRVILKPEFVKRYKKSHMWFIMLYFFVTFWAFCAVAMSDFNPNYRRMHQHPKQANVIGVLLKIKSRDVGRIMLHRVNELLKDGKTFALETTLATKSYRSKILEAQQNGYKVTLLFFWLDTVDMAIDRVKKRVSEGGHNIATNVIKRRYAGGIKNLFDIYIHVADEVMIFDNTNGIPEL